ncbi:pentatricopeptide repeat-containing protein At1g62914, mitochondrial-like [Magnolia sinica]|uniref:pentatricopeptide repeat-containing protein At1g62914, mitochondrial-like n=1 Tax=Magnolia sinica TaxID=86752 RepID=UPI00265B1E45|nr:pentatricopeptide repeat-containing protein At1g62914, mitochondrial-like [Magnolia sinica]
MASVRARNNKIKSVVVGGERVEGKARVCASIVKNYEELLSREDWERSTLDNLPLGSILREAVKSLEEAFKVKDIEATISDLDEESVNHLFLHCVVVKKVWEGFLGMFGSWSLHFYSSYAQLVFCGLLSFNPSAHGSEFGGAMLVMSSGVLLGSFISNSMVLSCSAELQACNSPKDLLSCSSILHMPSWFAVRYGLLSFNPSAHGSEFRGTLLVMSSGVLLGSILSNSKPELVSFFPFSFLLLLFLFGFIDGDPVLAGSNLILVQFSVHSWPSDVDAATLATFIKGFCMEGRIGEASSFFLKTIEMRYPYDVVTFGILIDGLSKLGNNGMALGLLREMEKGTGKCRPNLTVYTSIIDSLCKDGLAKEALNLFSKMVGKGIRPDVFTYSSLIHGLCNLGQWKEAMILLDEMLDGGISPNVTTFSILVNALCKEGMIKEARGLLELMTQRGEEPNVITYNALMDGYCFTSQMDAALKIFDNVVSKGHKPSVVTCNILIDGYCKNQMVDEAMQLFREMPCKGLEPNVVTYSTLICGLCRVQRVVAAQELFNEMQTHGQCPNVLTYTILMDGLCKNERPVEAMKLLNEMEI